MKTFILASKNKHKAEEIRQILGEDYEIKTMDEAGLENFEVVEDGLTFEENAKKKAVQVYQKVGIPTIADDSGLCVDFLNGAPGVHTARFAGENATDEMNISKLLNALHGVKDDKRGAEFVCVIAFADKNGCKLFRGGCKGYITNEKRGTSGFGYDPVFYYPEYHCTLAELGPEKKNLISHRAKALKLFAKSLNLS